MVNPVVLATNRSENFWTRMIAISKQGLKIMTNSVESQQFGIVWNDVLPYLERGRGFEVQSSFFRIVSDGTEVSIILDRYSSFSAYERGSLVPYTESFVDPIKFNPVDLYEALKTLGY